MRHMDDGRLQAWIDGPRSGLTERERAEVEAHLAECRRCATRAEELTEGDAEVAELLAAVAEDDAAIPDFAEVVARAEAAPEGGGADAGADGRGADSGVAPGEGVRLRRRIAPAWAATILVALGAGWLWNEMTRSGVEPGLIRPAVEAIPGSSPATDAPAASGSRAPDPASPQGEETEALKLSPDIQIPAPPEGSESDRATDRAAADAEPGATPQPDVAAGNVARGRVAQERPVDPGAGDAETPELRALAVAPGEVWQPVTLARADSILGGAVRTIPGLEVLAVQSGTWAGETAVRVRQALEDGAVLELYQLAAPTVMELEAEPEVAAAREAPASEAPSAAAEPRATGAPLVSEMATRTLDDGLRLRLAGPLPADSLEALLRRVR